MVEFALVLPLFFMLTIGLIDVGRAFYEYNAASHATREAARFASVNGGSQNPWFDWGNASTDPFNGNWPNTYSSATGHPAIDYVGTATIVGTVMRNLPPGIDLAGATVVVTAPAGPVPGNPVEISLQVPFQPLTALLAGGRSFTLAASSEMIIE